MVLGTRISWQPNNWSAGQENIAFMESKCLLLLLNPVVWPYPEPGRLQPTCSPSVKKKVKESRNRPGVAQRVPGGSGSQISWHSAREGGEVSLTHWPPLPPGMFLVLIFTRGWVNPRAMVRSEGNMSLKNPVTPPGIDPGTILLVAQHLNHYATPGHSSSVKNC